MSARISLTAVCGSKAYYKPNNKRVLYFQLEYTVDEIIYVYPLVIYFHFFFFHERSNLIYRRVGIGFLFLFFVTANGKNNNITIRNAICRRRTHCYSYEYYQDYYVKDDAHSCSGPNANNKNDNNII